MGTYFLDTSAIVKRYVPEPGHVWITTICDPLQDHKLYIAKVTLVEAVAAICRRARENSITVTDRDRLIGIFRRDAQKAYGIRLITNALCDYAGNLCRLHPLRTYDAIQLACALHLLNDALINQAPVPIFVSADINLVNIASTEGLSTVNPANHP